MRHFIRHPSSIPIEVSEAQSSGSGVHEVHNVSLGGLAFEAEHALPIGTIVGLRIAMLQPVFMTRARVVWCAPMTAQRYELGVEFLEANDVFRARMVEQVCHIEEYRQVIARTEGRALTSEQAAMEWISKHAATFPRS